MAKVHTRLKRMRKVGTHMNMRGRPGVKKVRPKTFDSEEKAIKWAGLKGIKEYTLVNLKNEASSRKKIKVVY